MKSLRFTIFAVLLSLSTVALAQSGQTPDPQMPEMQRANAPISDSQRSFDELKTLAGDWEGRVTTIPARPEVEGKAVVVTLRVTSMGNALVHEIAAEGRPDHPVTMFYLSGDRLLLTHYCDAGNRPRMTGKMTPDGKAVDFEFLDVDGSLQYGHMDHAHFTPIDANHHVEDWTYMEPGEKPVHAHFELQRTK